MGCVIARSHEAKQMGIQMGMPYFQAKRQFPGAIYLRGRHGIYSEFSKRIMDALRDFSPCVEVYSIDEAFVDLTGTRKMHKKNYYKIAQEMKTRIQEEIGISVSIGISITKTLAKMASDRAKKQPHTKKNPRCGIYIIGKSKIERELRATKIEDVWGVGGQSKKFFRSYGIKTAHDFVKQDERWVKQRMGKRGIDLKAELSGYVASKIDPEVSKPKSIQVTRSFMQCIDDRDFIKNQLKKHIKSACRKLRKEGGRAKSVCIMLRRKDFTSRYIREVFDDTLDFELDIAKFVFKGFGEIFEEGVLYRSCGITLDSITFEKQAQLNLFGKGEHPKSDRLAKSLDKLEKTYGKNVVRVGDL